MTTHKPGNESPGGQKPASPIVFYLDPRSGIPTYRQLVQQVDRALLLGYLRRGDQLPRLKDVTASLAINPDTVLKAYRELENKGIAAGRPGLGTFIVAEPAPVSQRQITELTKTLAAWLRTASAAGLDNDAIAALFTRALHDHDESATGSGSVSVA